MRDVHSIELIFAESLSTSFQSYVLSYCLPVIYTYIGTASKIKHFEFKKNVELRLKVKVGISPKPIK